jgi:hypothetical protein
MYRTVIVILMVYCSLYNWKLEDCFVVSYFRYFQKLRVSVIIGISVNFMNCHNIKVVLYVLHVI